MYKEVVGHTAVRKSSKVDAIVNEFKKRLMNLKVPEDFVNYNYFMNRLLDFDLQNRIEPQLKQQFRKRCLDSGLANLHKMDLEHKLRCFGDLIKTDPSIALSHKFAEVLVN